MRKTIIMLAMVAGATLALAADKFPEISTDELKKVIQEKKVTLLDVNGSESWQKGRIPGALDFTAVEANLAAKLPADKNSLIVAYCGNERCQAYLAGAQAAQKLGYTNVKHYAKGIQGWQKAGETTEKSN